ncbi:heparin lyase I family protein [Blastococcus xanthinilyticus]|uniref:Polysaccharide lyase-like protein n=1 Tax=Blastococcus xanthinilyticus TaxID=1564164 RepID=A0A5S5CR21_9ACTN|nr:heparin lyase I family protein [Blastococcus xanthinilyticus]TYP82086.1 polysaccharide lyase-like protein [Blastococcus xanthinilyticus]
MASRLARITVGGVPRVVDLLSGAPAAGPAPAPARVWHYEALAVGADPVPNPWSEFHGLRTDQREILDVSSQGLGFARALRFNVQPGDTGWGGTSGTLRSEVRASIAQSGSVTVGSEQWWAWPTFFPADFNWDENNQFLIFTQWRHGGAGSGNPNVGLWSDVNENLMLWVRGGSGGAVSGDAQYEKTYNLGPIVKGAWSRFMVHQVWSDDPATGLVEVYRNGVLLHSAADANLYTGDTIYIKQGIYSAAGTQRQHFITHGPLRWGSTRDAVENLPPFV